jgi:proliferating cell nuclear antigen
MFKAEFKDARIMKGIFDAVSAIISETVLKVTPEEGLTLTALDLSHICLVSLKLGKADFESFETDKDYELGINIGDLVKIIRRSGTDDSIIFSHDPKENKLIIKMQPSDGKRARRFTLGLIEVESEDLEMKGLIEMEFDNSCTMELKYLEEAIKDAEIMADVLEVKVGEDKKLNFSAQGTIGDMNYTLEQELMEKADFPEESIGVFAISFLVNILKISPIAKKVEVEMRSDVPLKLRFGILKESQILYFLAPRVEEDDDDMYED